MLFNLEESLSENIERDNPIKSMMCWNKNPVTQDVETEKIIKGP